MGVTELAFESKALKAKIKGVLKGYIIAMVTSDITKITKTYPAIIEHLFVIISVAATVKICCTIPSKYKSWRVLETDISHLNN